MAREYEGKEDLVSKWAIAGKYGLYNGTASTKSDAIDNHVRDLGIRWYECENNGDYPVRITVRYFKRKKGWQIKRKKKHHP